MINTDEYVKTNKTGFKRVVVGRTQIYYTTYKADEEWYKMLQLEDEIEPPSLLYCHVDIDGNIYVSDILHVKEHLRDNFQNLIAYHERIEYDWLKEIGITSPRWLIPEKTKESDIAEGIHNQAIWLEMIIAKKLGILDKYFSFRPYQDEVGNYYHKLKHGWVFDDWNI